MKNTQLSVQSKSKRRHISKIPLCVTLALFCLSLCLGVLSNFTVPVQALGNMTLDQLQAKFPAGKYWNGGNADSVTSTPCSHHSDTVCTTSGSCGCNSFKGLSIQCMGYAEKLGFDFTQFNPRVDANGWYTYYSSSALDSLKPGDIVRYNNHSIFVTDVNGDTVTFSDNNYKGTCQIRWGVTISLSYLRSNFVYLRSAPYAITATSVAYADISEGTYYIKNNGNGEYLSIAYGEDVNGQNVNTWDFAEATYEQMYLTNASSGYKIRALCCESRLINSYGSTVESGNNVNIWNDVEDASQWWGFEPVVGGYIIRNMMNQSCVMAKEDSSQNIYITTYTGSANQIWSLQNTVSYDANGGTGAPATQLKDYGQNLTLSTVTPTRDGYSFVGWAANASATDAQYSAADIFTANTNTTLYAVWKDTGDLGLEYVISDSAVTITGYSGSAKELTIPETIEDCRVTAIGDSAFCQSSLTSITLPDSITTIGAGAFSVCENLSSINIPEGVTHIGDFAFTYCSSLTEIVLPNSVTSIGSNVFECCYGLKHVTLPAYLTEISEYAFYQCFSITGITLPETITSIGNCAFGSCNSLSSISIPKNVLSIGDLVFECENLTGIWVDENNTYYSNDSSGVLFNKGKTQLIRAPRKLEGTYRIPESVCVVNKFAFSLCFDLQEIIFTSTAPDLGSYVFNVIEADVYYPANDDTWTSNVRQEYGGSISWIPLEAWLYESGAEKAKYSSFSDALTDYAGHKQYIKLAGNASVDISLTQDLYIDLNGYDLSGVITLNGYQVFGMDSTTDSYTCDSIGCFNCVDEMGEPVVPELHWRSDVTGNIKRYLRVEKNGTYSFHRFYIGIVATSIKPGTDSVGYKAVFAGDEMVKNYIDTYGYSIRLGTGTPITAEKPGDKMQSGKAVTLRIDGYDAENYGEAKLTARTFITVDGETIYSTSYTSSLRDMIERINEQAGSLTASQLAALKEMLERYAVMQTWKVENLL